MCMHSPASAAAAERGLCLLLPCLWWFRLLAWHAAASSISSSSCLLIARSFSIIPYTYTSIHTLVSLPPSRNTHYTHLSIKVMLAQLCSSILPAALLTLGLAGNARAQGNLDETNNITSLQGTWASGSGGVQTGPVSGGLCSVVDLTMLIRMASFWWSDVRRDSANPTRLHSTIPRRLESVTLCKFHTRPRCSSMVKTVARLLTLGSPCLCQRIAPRMDSLKKRNTDTTPTPRTHDVSLRS